MFRKTIIAGTAAIALSAAAFTPALANYAACTENPGGNGCPGAIAQTPSQESLRMKVSEPRQAQAHERAAKHASARRSESGTRHASRIHEAAPARNSVKS
jgi:hypothetical protein